mmetsp:Transcript_37092/g.148018  ORF Transcript_37092/g.148018 Transcript_37092/m.148018 type:complete len:245 (-) Transcript_37092:900-1634(-)
MSEYWVSNARHHCKYCKVWIADNKIQRRQHEEGLKHKDNVERFISNMKEENQKKKQEELRKKEELFRINQAAERAHFHDLYKHHPDANESYGTYDAYGGWYDAHGNYYTYKDEKWENVGFFPEKNYVPGAEQGNARPDSKLGPTVDAVGKPDEKEPVEELKANEIGEWKEVKESHHSSNRGQKRKVVISVKDETEKRPGAEDSEDEDEAKAASGWKASDGAKGNEPVTFKKSARGKRKLRKRDD